MTGEWQKDHLLYDRWLTERSSSVWQVSDSKITFCMTGEWQKDHLLYDRWVTERSSSVWQVSDRKITFCMTGDWQEDHLLYDRWVTGRSPSVWQVSNNMLFCYIFFKYLCNEANTRNMSMIYKISMHLFNPLKARLMEINKYLLMNYIKLRYCVGTESCALLELHKCK